MRAVLCCERRGHRRKMGKEMGIFAEVVPHGQELERAWGICPGVHAEGRPPAIVRRMTREQITRPARGIYQGLPLSLCHEWLLL
jgi:hypothetical protein